VAKGMIVIKIDEGDALFVSRLLRNIANTHRRNIERERVDGKIQSLRAASVAMTLVEADQIDHIAHGFGEAVANGSHDFRCSSIEAISSHQ
jgi:hypothetical protein